MKTKADLLAHIIALTESGELKWKDDAGGYVHSELNGATVSFSRGQLFVWRGGESPLGMVSTRALAEAIDNSQPLPEWVQKVGE